MTRFLWVVLWVSIIGSLLTVHFYGGCFDDAVQMIHNTTGRDPVGWLYWHAWGMNAYLKALVPFLGKHYDLYRLAVMPFGLLAYLLLAWIVRRSPLAVLGLASLLWMPETYCSFRILRYDGIILLALAINLWGIRKKTPISLTIAGMVAGMIPMIALPGILVAPTAFLYLCVTREDFYPIFSWAMGCGWGGLYTLMFYPWDRYSENVTLYRNLYGMCATKVPGFMVLGNFHEIIHRVFMVSDFDLNWNHFAAAPFYWVFFGVTLWTWRRPLSRFALSFALVHFLFSMSYYPVLLFPLMVMAAGDAVK